MHQSDLISPDTNLDTLNQPILIYILIQCSLFPKNKLCIQHCIKLIMIIFIYYYYYFIVIIILENTHFFFLAKS